MDEVVSESLDFYFMELEYELDFYFDSSKIIICTLETEYPELIIDLTF